MSEKFTNIINILNIILGSVAVVFAAGAIIYDEITTIIENKKKKDNKWERKF